MKRSGVNLPRKGPVQEEPQVISLPQNQVTVDPRRGYTTEDFWRDFEAEHSGRSAEFERFEQLTSRLVRVAKSDLDGRRKD